MKEPTDWESIFYFCTIPPLIFIVGPIVGFYLGGLLVSCVDHAFHLFTH